MKADFLAVVKEKLFQEDYIFRKLKRKNCNGFPWLTAAWCASTAHIFPKPVPINIRQFWKATKKLYI
jgi:hypothetical protein